MNLPISEVELKYTHAQHTRRNITFNGNGVYRFAVRVFQDNDRTVWEGGCWAEKKSEAHRIVSAELSLWPAWRGCDATVCGETVI